MLKDYTHIVIVLDKSSSMSSIADSVKSGLAEFMKTQRELQGKVTMSIYSFDTLVTRHCVFADLEFAGKFLDTYSPAGMTAMNDGICRAIDETGERLAKINEDNRPQNVVFFIITDGQENASVDYKIEDVKMKVQHQKDVYKWQFTFLGTDIDAIGTGAQYGIALGTSVNFTKTDVGVRAAFAMASGKLSAYRGTGDAKNMEYTDTDRAILASDSTSGAYVPGSGADRSVGGSVATKRGVVRGNVPSAV